MKKSIIILGTIFLLSSFVQQDTRKALPNNAYVVGEELDFLMYYGIINIGRASMTVREFPSKDKRTIYHAKAEARTVGITKVFTSLHHIYESFFDELDGKPIKAVRNVKESNYSDYDEALFDHETHRVKSLKKGIVQVPDNIYDIISSVYYMRRVGFTNLAVNDTLRIQTYFTDKVFEYEIVYKGKEQITTRLGTFNALKFQPVVETGRSFKTKDDMRFWLSADKGHVPLRAEFDLRIGSIKCDLIGHKGLKNKLVPVK
jgi:hypothetical protein